MFVPDSNSPYAQEDQSAYGFGVLPSKVYGVNTRYGIDAVGGTAWDIVAKGGLPHLRDGFIFGKTGAGIKTAFKLAGPFSLMNLAVDVPISAFKAGMAPRGHKIGAGVASFSAGMLSYIPAAIFGGPIAGAISEATLGPVIEKGINKAFTAFTDAGRYYSTVHLGGGYLDTQQNFTMRQRAASELANGLLNARQHLSQEAMLMHQ